MHRATASAWCYAADQVPRIELHHGRRTFRFMQMPQTEDENGE